MFGFHQPPPSYTFTKLDFIPYDLNDEGRIVGSTGNGKSECPVVFHDNRMERLKSSQGFGRACLINKRNHIVISTRAEGIPSEPNSSLDFWNRGKVTHLGAFDAEPTRLLDEDEFLSSVHQHQFRFGMKNGRLLRSNLPNIYRKPNPDLKGEFEDLNDRGTLVGACWGGEGPRTAFVMDRLGRRTDLTKFADREISYSAQLINDSGTIVVTVGFGQAWGGGEAVEVWKGGQMKELPSMFHSWRGFQVHGLNEKDQIIGSGSLQRYDGSTAQRIENDHAGDPYFALAMDHAVLWEGGNLYDLNDLVKLPEGVELENATRINNKGWIVGTYILLNHRFGFLLKPQSTASLGQS